jgi:hypothetical protein
MSDDFADQIADLRQQLLYGRAARDSLINDLIANCNQLRDRCWKTEGDLAKWQEIAIEATAKAIFCNEQWNIDTNSPMEEDFWRDFEAESTKATHRERAAKELDLQISQEESYLKRLEDAYLEFVEGNVKDHWPKRDPIKEAQAALAKIREGKD